MKPKRYPLRKQFERETNIDIYKQTTEVENYHRLWTYIEWLEKKVDEYRIKYKTSNVRYEMLVRSLQAIVLDGKKYLLNKNKIEDKKE